MKHFPKLTDTLNPVGKKHCKSCGLYLNQYPALDKFKAAGVFWVGLSAVKFDEGSSKQPLSPETRSGELILNMEDKFKEVISFYRTNLVKCLPWNNSTGKIRYPLKPEMEKCFANLLSEIEELQPAVVFLLGKQVSDFVLSKYSIKTGEPSGEFEYNSYSFGGFEFVPVHHPSYILVYKRRFVANYIAGISKHLQRLLEMSAI
ncbi:MAG: uracil-DNA glycosylase family protein [Imperialibacter sp.]|uniref:uracil-DNA glycosylase family protein n=1 Tax=Imperialibacter sp. TaxID=2038411 RepID=UPI003A89D63E